MRKALSLVATVAITLRKLATNIEYRTLSDMFGVGKSTVGIVVIDQ